MEDVSEEDLEIARYGIEIYLMNLYKVPIIFGVAYLIGIFNYCILVYIVFGILRNYSCGMHMKSGFTCLLFSGLAFFSIVFISKTISLNLPLKIIISILSIYFIHKYSPADTEELPILNENIRRKNNKISIFLGGILILISFIYPNKIISNVLLFTLLLQIIMIHPITYKLFNRRYNNYVQYKKN